MVNSTQMNFTVDSRTKGIFDIIAKQMGLSSSALLNIFVTRVVNEGRVPFML
ncbi:MAG: type II toxin-antitoxin system RelB/DinJ family antitoxin [Streptococcaceae bacterium]|jgi:DNA-damage-inducible protein J|nr:type II toxin-antitoxin system RelB/DinJ family antitoxin [Streptococcaceae bacterium]